MKHFFLNGIQIRFNKYFEKEKKKIYKYIFIYKLKECFDINFTSTFERKAGQPLPTKKNLTAYFFQGSQIGRTES